MVASGLAEPRWQEALDHTDAPHLRIRLSRCCSGHLPRRTRHRSVRYRCYLHRRDCRFGYYDRVLVDGGRPLWPTSYRSDHVGLDVSRWPVVRVHRPILAAPARQLHRDHQCYQCRSWCVQHHRTGDSPANRVGRPPYVGLLDLQHARELRRSGRSPLCRSGRILRGARSRWCRRFPTVVHPLRAGRSGQRRSLLLTQ